MANAKTVRYSGLKVLLGDGATPDESFGNPCGLTERSLTLTKEFGETNTPDCEDEDLASWVERDVVSKSAEIAGSGVIDADSILEWQAFFDSDTSRNVRVELWRLGVKIGHWQGAFHLGSFAPSATKGERATVEVSLSSDGRVNWTPAP